MRFLNADKFFQEIDEKFAEGDVAHFEKHVESSNLKTLKKLFEAIHVNDFAGASTHFTDDIVQEIRGSSDAPFVVKVVGRDAVRDQLIKNFGALTEQRPVIERLTAQGDTLVLQIKETGRMIEADAPYDVRAVQIYSFRGDKLASMVQIIESPVQ